MAEIKSAYEKAMERFKDVEPDLQSLKENEFKDKGAKLCVQKLHGEEVNLEKELSSVTGDEQEWLKEGFGNALLAQISLPSSEAEIAQIDIIKEIAMSVSPQTTVVGKLLDQYKELCEQYLETKEDLAEQMKAQYMQMMQQHGAQGQSNPTMEASFVKSMQKQLQDLESQFKPAVQQVKQNLRQLCGFSLEK